MSEREAVKARNRKARHEYHVLETIEMGIVLKGSEIKSIRAGKVSIAGAYAQFDQDSELWLRGAHIAEYPQARDNHDPDRHRKLLAHRRELRKIKRKVEEKGVTLVPLDVHISPRGKAKVLIGLCRGKSMVDKRADIAERETKRRMDAAMKHALRER